LATKAGILDRHLDRGNRIGAADVGVEVDMSFARDLDGLVLGQCWRREAECGKRHGRGEAPRNLIVMVFLQKWLFAGSLFGTCQRLCDSPSRGAGQSAYRSASEISLNFWIRLPVSTSAV